MTTTVALRQVGLDPLSRPFEWLLLHGSGLVPYAGMTCAHQLCAKHDLCTNPES